MREPIFDLETAPRLHRQETPPATGQAAIGAGHLVLRTATHLHVVAGELCRPRLRPPEPLELPRIGIRLPKAIHRNGIFTDDGQAESSGVGCDGLDRHDSLLAGVSEN